jgi:hypothetical protein
LKGGSFVLMLIGLEGRPISLKYRKVRYFYVVIFAMWNNRIERRGDWLGGRRRDMVHCRPTAPVYPRMPAWRVCQRGSAALDTHRREGALRARSGYAGIRGTFSLTIGEIALQYIDIADIMQYSYI